MFFPQCCRLVNKCVKKGKKRSVLNTSGRQTLWLHAVINKEIRSFSDSEIEMPLSFLQCQQERDEHCIATDTVQTAF